MAVDIFNDALANAVRKGMLPGKTKESREWFRNAGKKLSGQEVLASADAYRKQTAVGNMYMFYYDPKWKKDLPYYDRFPLIFPFRRMKGGFMGINMHYLPHVLRAKLMDTLYEFTNNKKMDETTRLQISWSVLSTAASSKYIAPTVKRYLTPHVRSRFIKIEPAEWELALMLPVEQFEKATKEEVWADSRKIIRGG